MTRKCWKTTSHGSHSQNYLTASKSRTSPIACLLFLVSPIWSRKMSWWWAGAIGAAKVIRSSPSPYIVTNLIKISSSYRKSSTKMSQHKPTRASHSSSASRASSGTALRRFFLSPTHPAVRGKSTASLAVLVPPGTQIIPSITSSATSPTKKTRDRSFRL